MLNPLPGRTSMVIKNEVLKVSEDATQNEMLEVGLK